MKNKVKKASKEYEEQVKCYQEVRYPYVWDKYLSLILFRTRTNSSASMQLSSSLWLPLHQLALPLLQGTKRLLKAKRKKMDSRQLEKAAKASSILLNPSSRFLHWSMRIVVKRYVRAHFTLEWPVEFLLEYRPCGTSQDIGKVARRRSHDLSKDTRSLSSPVRSLRLQSLCDTHANRYLVVCPKRVRPTGPDPCRGTRILRSRSGN